MPDYQGSAIYDPNGFARLRPFGPFIDPRTFEMQPTTVRSLIIATVVFGVAMMFAGLAVVIGIQQTKASRNPWKSTYIWMIWIELGACIIIAIECMLYLTYVIRPSFYFYMSILFVWALQINLLLQIIINRIRIILLDRQRGRILAISVAVFIVALNISVFCIWVPARLQISRYYIHINDIWDRTEKGIYLLVDGALNFYFIRVVRTNLVVNGLQKYERLVRFNERIIIISLLMDVMIIGAMSIPNGFVYTLFHPLAFLVKLNIEMTMANLIRQIALEDSNLQTTFLATYASESSASSSLQFSSPKSPTSLRELMFPSFSPNRHNTWWGRSPSQEDGIKKTEEFTVRSRRVSQMSAHVFGVSKYQTDQKEDVLAMEDVGLASGHVVEERRESGVTSVHAASDGATIDRAASYATGDEVELIPPPATLERQ